MARNEKRRQQALHRQASRRRQKRQASALATTGGVHALIRAAARWPLYECLVTRDWNVEGEIVQVVVARRSPASGEIAAGVFLVDLGCLGVKNAFVTEPVPSPQAYASEIRAEFTDTQQMILADLDLAAKIIREAIAYARTLGFPPHRDYREAALFLEGADPDACDAQIPLGKDGKPFFVAGPYDNGPRIIRQLSRTVGPGNFDYIVPVPETDDYLDDLDEE